MSIESVYTPHGRKIVFTPERLEQIRNLVERGHNREQIAEIIGCTVGSLQVTCSRLGISLRRPDNGRPNGKAHPPPPPAPPAEPPVTLTLVVEHRGRIRKIPIQLPREALGQLILEAEIRGLRLSELIVEVLTECIAKRKIT